MLRDVISLPTRPVLGTIPLPMGSFFVVHRIAGGCQPVISSAMFVLPTSSFGEPIRKSAGCLIYDSGRVYSRRPDNRPELMRMDHTTRDPGTPMLTCGLSKIALPRHCGGGFFSLPASEKKGAAAITIRTAPFFVGHFPKRRIRRGLPVGHPTKDSQARHRRP